MVAFDTLAYSKRLQEAGVPSAQAEAHAVAQADFLTHYLLIEVVTKTDLATVKTELKTDLTELKAELKSDIAEVKSDMVTKADLAEMKTDMATKTDIAELKTDMAEMETRLTMRMLFMVGILAALMTVFKFMG